MREVADLDRARRRDHVPVLVLGETGTGKGVGARAIHAEGPRARAPFVAVNCAALPENLLESELFGHVKGAFTGANQARGGLFAEADGGTLLLDEIGEMSPGAPGEAPPRARERHRAARRWDEGTCRSTCASWPRRTAICARGSATGEFREDLLYRLDVVTLELPPLRHRRDDLPDLLAHFLARARTRHPQSPVESFAPDAVELLLDYTWPGNVRELEHLIERVVVLGRSPQVMATDLPLAVRTRSPQYDALLWRGAPDSRAAAPLRGMGFPAARGPTRLTAEKLGIDEKTLARWLADDPVGR